MTVLIQRISEVGLAAVPRTMLRITLSADERSVLLAVVLSSSPTGFGVTAVDP
uniref:Uncharacterized protein n=1 Tax=Anguilla anguilla TaxID=7936 RepID=A0A0E9RP06_ANGAN